MTTVQVVETSVTVNNNSPIQDYIHPDDHTQPTYEMSSWVQTFLKKREILLRCYELTFVPFVVNVHVIQNLSFSLVSHLNHIFIKAKTAARTWNCNMK